MIKKYSIKDLSEFEVLTLREGLFLFKKNLTEKEFKELDNKIKKVFKEEVKQ